MKKVCLITRFNFVALYVGEKICYFEKMLGDDLQALRSY